MEDDEIEFWNEYKIERKEKKKSNEKYSIELLKKNGFPVELLNQSISHYRVYQFNFWPTTGLFYNPKTKEKGRGVKHLIKILKAWKIQNQI